MKQLLGGQCPPYGLTLHIEIYGQLVMVDRLLDLIDWQRLPLPNSFEERVVAILAID